MRWFEENLANHRYGRERRGITCCEAVGVDNLKMFLLRASMSDRHENSVTSGTLTGLSDTLSSCGHHYCSKVMLS
jgi:hypothetical protein